MHVCVLVFRTGIGWHAHALKVLVCHVDELVCHVNVLVCHVNDLVCHVKVLVWHVNACVCHANALVHVWLHDPVGVPSFHSTVLAYTSPTFSFSSLRSSSPGRRCLNL